MQTRWGPEAHVHYWQIYVQSVHGEDWPDQVIKQTSKIAGMWHGVLFEEVRQAFPGLSPTPGPR